MLEMVAAHLVREDPARAMEMMLHGPYQVQSFQDLLSFASALVRETAVVDPITGFEELQKKEANLHRQSLAKWFSDELAKKNPALAAERFEESLELRDQGKKQDENYARLLLKSWMDTDRQAAQAFINDLPSGETRQLFENAQHQLQPPADGAE